LYDKKNPGKGLSTTYINYIALIALIIVY